MINYCFGSKEALFYEAFKDLQDSVLEYKPELAEIMNSDMAPKDKLIEGSMEMVKLMLEYFSMAQAIVKFCVMNKKMDLNNATYELVKAHFAGRKTDGECMLIAYAFNSSIELMVLRHKEISETCGIDMTDETVIRNIIVKTVNKCLAEV